MKLFRTPTRLLSFAAVLFAAASLGNAQDSAPLDPAEAFAEGNAAFAQGDFAAAAVAYESALVAGSSANLHYNLGTAYARTGDWGRASLHLLKALALDPNHPDARAHLALVRERSGLGWEERGALQQAATLLPLSAWAWLATVGFWGALFLWILRPAGGSAALLLGRLGLSGLFLLAAFALAVYHFERDRGVVIEPVALRVAPTPSSPRAAELEAGLQGDILRSLGDYYLVRTEGGDEGYLTSDEFAPVWE